MTGNRTRCRHRTSGDFGVTPIKSGWRKKSLCSLFLALALLVPAAAGAASERNHAREDRRIERLDKHQSRRHDVPRNARYKNPPHNARYKNPPRHDRGRYDERGHHGNGPGRGERYVGRYHGGGKHRDHYGNPHHGDRHKHRHHHKKHHRTRVYHHYEYVPYYAPVVVAYPYYCDLCHSGFYADHVFYDHVYHVHHVPRAGISSLLHFDGGTFYFGVGLW